VLKLFERPAPPKKPPPLAFSFAPIHDIASPSRRGGGAQLSSANSCDLLRFAVSSALGKRQNTMTDRRERD
jgi:hypothetical protein